jgi:Tfp pilus assembly protein PilF
MRHLRSLLLLLFPLLLSACATQPVPPPPPQLFADHLFQPSTDIIAPQQIFALTPQMVQYVDAVRRSKRSKEARKALFDALYRRDQLQLDYDSSITRTAAEAFAARRGNCLSLVIMTAALAEELEIPVILQQVNTEESWTRSGSLYFNSGHVNLRLGTDKREDFLYGESRFALVDFMPPTGGESLRTHAIKRNTVIAMFMNNRAAEAMVRGEIDNAYWWARSAIENDPALLHAYNTLAIVYQRHGDLPQAETALRYAMLREPENTMVMANLVHVLNASGAYAEAAVLKTRLAELQPRPPFYYFNLGQQAMKDGDYLRARKMFERELARDDTYHEFHFWLAAAAFQLGDVKTANEQMKQALTSSTTPGDHELYAAKLDRLRAYQTKLRQ